MPSRILVTFVHMPDPRRAAKHDLSDRAAKGKRAIVTHASSVTVAPPLPADDVQDLAPKLAIRLTRRGRSPDSHAPLPHVIQ